MTRAAIYARYSDELQSDRSIDDQIATDRAYCDRMGLRVVAVYIDRATSGASLHHRTDMQRLLADARRGIFDVVVAETMSRIGRNEGDRAYIRERLTFAGITVMTPTYGVVTKLTDGITAVMDSQQLDEIKIHIRRGMAGVTRDGRHAGGRAYGYRPVRGLIDARGEPIRGHLAIVETEAEIVRRIYAEYAAASSPREIAARLNADHIPAPRGRAWRASTIAGNTGRGHSMIANELYAGVIVWNRIRMIKNPDTGKRVSRINPQPEWQRVPAEHLRIVPAALWEAVQARRKARTGISHRARVTPRRVLSGLLRCGVCGGGMSISDTDRKGKRIVCSAYHEGRACSHGRKYYLAAIEDRTINALKSKLGSRAALACFVRRYNETRARLAGKATAERMTLERRTEEAKRDLDRAIDNLVRGRISEAEADAILPGLRAEHARLAAEIATAPTPPKVVSLHPAAVDRYLADLDHLADALAKQSSDGHHEAALAVRRMVEFVTVMPASAGTPPELFVDGHLSSLTGIPGFPKGTILSGGQMVAGEGFGQDIRPVSYRISA